MVIIVVVKLIFSAVEFLNYVPHSCVYLWAKNFVLLDKSQLEHLYGGDGVFYGLDLIECNRLGVFMCYGRHYVFDVE